MSKQITGKELRLILQQIRDTVDGMISDIKGIQGTSDSNFVYVKCSGEQAIKGLLTVMNVLTPEENHKQGRALLLMDYIKDEFGVDYTPHIQASRRP